MSTIQGWTAIQEEQFKKEFGKEGTTSVPLLEDDAKRVFVQVDQDKSLGMRWQMMAGWRGVRCVF